MAIEIVDQYYWLGYAKKAIDNSAGKLDEAAGKISTLVTAFWTIYTTAFIIGTTINKLDETPTILFLLVLPIPLLIFAYISALWAQMPALSLKGLDPRVPADIMQAYIQNIREKKIRLGVALGIFILAGLSLTIALIFGNFTHVKNDSKQIVSVTADKDKVFIAGDLPANTMVYYSIASANNKSGPDSTLILQQGHFDRSLSAPKSTDYIINVSWKDAGDVNITHVVSKHFPLPKVDPKTKK